MKRAILEALDMVPARSDYEICGWSTGDDEFFLSVRVRSAIFSIQVSPENFLNSPIALKTLRIHMESLLSDTDNSESVELWDYLDWIVATFLPSFQHLAPAVRHSGKLTLAHLYMRQHHECQLHVEDETPSAGRISSVEPIASDEWEEEPYDVKGSLFPTLALSDIEVSYDDPTTVFEIMPEKVIFQNHELFWKPCYVPELSVQEIDKHARIAQAGLPPGQLCTSRLYGVVLSAKGSIRGLLYHWIEVADTLTWAIDERTPFETRDKYASQITLTLNSLHQLDIVWGDVKAENVVIDKDGNAIVIDLEGGSTRNWVDKDLAGTIDGDLQGLERLMDYIYNDGSTLRHREKPETEFDGEDSGEKVES